MSATNEIAKSLKVGRAPNQVIVEHAGEKVVVRWENSNCGTREFSVHKTREIILCVDGLLEKYPEMWLKTADGSTYAKEFYLNLKDGKLTANSSAAETKRVSWASLKKALEEIVGHVEGELGEHKTSSTQAAQASATKKGSR